MRNEKGMAIMAILLIGAGLSLVTGYFAGTQVVDYQMRQEKKLAEAQQLEIRDIAVVEQGDET